MPIYSVTQFGAAGDGVRNDASAIQNAIDSCHAAGGGMVVVPAGCTCLSGSFTLRSHVEFHVEPGASVIASLERKDYSRVAGRITCFINADGAAHVRISGGGVIDCRGTRFMREEGAYIFIRGEWRPRMFLLENCRHLTIRDITIRDGAQWTLHLAGCRDVVISGIRILNSLKVPNSDAIDLDCCKNVRISDCHIESGDDCICLKTCPGFAERYGACENITVTGCTLMSTSGALVIGCEAKAPMRNVVFDACVVRSSHRGLAIHLNHEADVENVIFSNCIVETRVFNAAWWGAGEALYVVANPWTAEDRIGTIRNVRFSNILCRCEGGVMVRGSSPGVIENIVFDGVRVEMDKWSKWPTRRDLRPLPGYGDAALEHGVTEQPVSAFHLECARGVTLRNCEVAWKDAPRDCWRHALESHGVEGLTLENFRGQAADPARDAAQVID